ncbi:MAG: hypothetical protein ABI333_22685 [bacterium]
MKVTRYGTIPIVLMAVGLLWTKPAAAESYRNDLNLANLYRHHLQGATTPEAIRNGQINANRSFRSLMSQLGMALAPQYHAPAETTGFNGFAVVAKYAFTTIDDGSEYWENGLNRAPDPFLHTLSMDIRKGIWMPLPSFELGAGFTHLVSSHMFSLNAFAKFSLHEGFLHWPTPAIAIRFTGQRIVGTSQVDLTIVGLDVSISKSFGVGGIFNFTPYLGYNILWIWADSQVIDTTPGTDSLQCSADDPGCSFTTPIRPGQFCDATNGDCNNNYVFDDQDPIFRHRIFVGLRIIFYHVVLTIEGAWALKGSSKDDLALGLAGDPIKDRAKVQQTYSFSIGWDY